MHRNRRYVKLGWIGLLAALSLPSLARAEVDQTTNIPYASLLRTPVG
jgi:hypothetical protein